MALKPRPTRAVGADHDRHDHRRAGRAGHHDRPAVADRARQVALRQRRRSATSIAFTSFALCLIVAAFECRSETETVLTTATFDSKQMNWAALGEFVLAVLATQMDVFNRLLGTTQINLRQFGWALVPAVALLVLWELGKLIARRTNRVSAPQAPSPRNHPQPSPSR